MSKRKQIKHIIKKLPFMEGGIYGYFFALYDFLELTDRATLEIREKEIGVLS